MSDTLHIPHFIEGKDKIDLQKKMLKLQLESGIVYRFYDIQKDGNGWVAWYSKKVKEVPK